MYYVFILYFVELCNSVFTNVNLCELTFNLVLHQEFSFAYSLTECLLNEIIRQLLSTIQINKEILNI